MIKVFFDGKCGLCRREIAYYRRIAPPSVFEWVDITVHSAPLLELNVAIQDGLRILHVQGRDGKLYQGIDGFVRIWENIPRFRWLARIVRLKFFYRIASFLYKKFAAWHYIHMGYPKCDI